MSGMPKGKRLDEARVLHLGCGNSRLGEELYDDGVTQITNLDYSSEVIADLAERHEWERPEMSWVAMDAADLDSEEVSGMKAESFDVLVDKAMLDAISCLPDGGLATMERVAKGGARVLKTGGTWIILSFNAPGVFLPALQSAPGISWRTSTLGRLHLYTGTKF